MMHMTLLQETQGVITWGNFKKAFLEEYFPKADKDSKVTEFFELKQGTMTVAEYAKKFSTLIRYAPWVARNMQEKMHRFLMGLKPQIYDRVVANRSNTYAELLDRAKLAESGLAAVTQEISSGGTSSGKRPTPILQRTILKRIKGPSHQDYFAKAKCETCGGNHHTSTCYRTTRACFRCGKTDHIAKDCTQPKPRPDQVGQQGHKVRTVRVIRRPVQNKNTNGGQAQQKPQARVYALTEEQAEEAEDDVIAGNNLNEEDEYVEYIEEIIEDGDDIEDVP
ncbi:uncharacterized protein LOC142542793 [Primulina tabacum]|uniref:uncharacterized protein LOC142542793 n=1 Tax=Primulina tabacum TaxID=48773 RepID=UPI003F5AD667